MVNQFTSPIAFDAARFITVHNNQPRTTSLLVAECFGKRHDNIIRKIHMLDCSQEFHALNFEEMIIEVEIGKGAKRKTPVYEMTKDGFIFLVMGFTGHKAAAIKEAYINAFNLMALQLIQHTNHEARYQNVNAMINYAMMLSERERNFIAEERQLKAKFKMLEAAMAEYQDELENYSDRRRQYRDIVEHLHMVGSLLK
jgi:phage regulatory protein, rha family